MRASSIPPLTSRWAILPPFCGSVSQSAIVLASPGSRPQALSWRVRREVGSRLRRRALRWEGEAAMRLFVLSERVTREERGCERAVERMWGVEPEREMSLFDRISSVRVGSCEFGGSEGSRR